MRPRARARGLSLFSGVIATAEAALSRSGMPKSLAVG